MADTSMNSGDIDTVNLYSNNNNITGSTTNQMSNQPKNPFLEKNLFEAWEKDGRYTPVKSIGKGSYGHVIKAVDR
jgi:hypothetical protein